VRGSIPIGTPGFVRGYLNEVVYPRVERDAVAVQDSLGNAYPQQRWLMLYHSTQYTIDYWLQHCAPEDTLELATAFDTLILRLAGAALGQSFVGVEHGVDRLRLPVRMGGLGLRSRVDLRDAAFVGMAAKVVPALVHAPSAPPSAQGHFCTAVIADKVGERSFSAENNRYDFSRVTSSGCRMGSILASAWPLLQQKAAGGGPGSSPSTGALAADLSKLGYGISNLQHAISTELDKASLRELQARVDAGGVRARAAFRNQDEFSRAFLLARPSPGYALTSAEWRECVARYIGAPSPACAPFVGQQLHVSGRGGDGTVDVWGDNLLTACTQGDLESKLRHDPLVALLGTAARNVGGLAFTEHAAFYHSAIPPGAYAARAAQAALQHAAQPQCYGRLRVMRPDVVYKLNPGEPWTVAEVKTCSFSRTWYGASGVGGVATRERAALRELRSKARAHDRLFGLAQLAPGGHGANVTPGPIEGRLHSARVVAAVSGSFAEGGRGLHDIVAAMAEEGGRQLCLRMGTDPVDAAARIKRLLTNRIGVLAARGTAQLLLARLEFAGPAAAQRAARRSPGQHVVSLAALGAQAGVAMGACRAGFGGGGRGLVGGLLALGRGG
jgi:hypothetical protein